MNFILKNNIGIYPGWPFGLFLPGLRILAGPCSQTIIMKNLPNINKKTIYWQISVGSIYILPHYGGEYGSIFDCRWGFAPWRPIIHVFKSRLI